MSMQQPHPISVESQVVRLWSRSRSRSNGMLELRDASNPSSLSCRRKLSPPAHHTHRSWLHIMI